MSEDPNPTVEAGGGRVQRRAAWLEAKLRPVVQVAGAIVGKVRLQAVLAGLSAVWLWGLLFYPFAAFDRTGIVVLAVLALGVLLAPAAVLLLFWAGLRALIAVPDQLLAMAGAGEGHAQTLYRTVMDDAEPRKVRRIGRFFRTVLDLRGLILESKELLLQFAVVARLANPVFIATLFVCFVLSLLLIVVAAASMVFVALF